ncbi:MAG: hypothetical protein ACOCMZ_07075, partial [Acetivibrio ethanolgignens]
MGSIVEGFSVSAGGVEGTAEGVGVTASLAVFTGFIEQPVKKRRQKSKRSFPVIILIILLDYLDFQIIKINRIYKIVLGEPGL